MGTHISAGATELAMLKFIQRCGVDYVKLRSTHIDPETKLRFPFDSARKRMSTVIDTGSENTDHGYAKRIHTKGASEIILGTCTHYLNESGTKVPLDDQMM
jgi:Ca2+-transporting ATPase